MSELKAQPDGASPLHVGPLMSVFRNTRTNVAPPDRGHPFGNFLRAVELDNFSSQAIQDVLSGGFEYENDPEYSALTDPQTKPWAHLIFAFKDSQSVQETADIIRRLERNDQLRNQLEGYQAGWSRFFGAAIDPVNLIPVPALRGIGFMKGAARGTLYIGGANVATELALQKLDPGRPQAEMWMNMGTGLLLGTALGGVAGGIKYKGGYREAPSLLTVIPGYERMQNYVADRFNIGAIGERFDQGMRGASPATSNLMSRALAGGTELVADHFGKFSAGVGRNRPLYEWVSNRVIQLQENLDAYKRWVDQGSDPDASVPIRTVDGEIRDMPGTKLSELGSVEDAQLMVDKLRGTLQEDDIVNFGSLSNDELHAIGSAARKGAATPEAKVAVEEMESLDHWGPADAGDAWPKPDQRGRLVDSGRVQPTRIDEALGLTSRAEQTRHVHELGEAVQATKARLAELKHRMTVLEADLKAEGTEYKRGDIISQMGELEERIGQAEGNARLAQEVYSNEKRILDDIEQLHDYNSSKLAPTKVGAEHIHWSQMPWYKLVNNPLEKISPRLAHQLRLTAQKLAAPVGVRTRGQIEGTGARPVAVEGAIMLWRDVKNRATDAMEQQYLAMLGKHMDAGATRGAITMESVKNFPRDTLAETGRMFGFGNSSKLKSLMGWMSQGKKPTYREFREAVGIYRATNGSAQGIPQEMLQFVEASSRAMDEFWEEYRTVAQEFGLFKRQEDITKDLEALDVQLEAQGRRVTSLDEKIQYTTKGDTRETSVARTRLANEQQRFADMYSQREQLQEELDVLNSMSADDKRMYFHIQWDKSAIDADYDGLRQIVHDHYKANPKRVTRWEKNEVGEWVERELNLEERVTQTMDNLTKQAYSPDEVEAIRAKFRNNLVSRQLDLMNRLGLVEENYPTPKVEEQVGPTGVTRKDGSYSYANITMRRDGSWVMRLDEDYVRRFWDEAAVDELDDVMRKEAADMRAVFETPEEAIAFMREHEYAHARMRRAVGENYWKYEQEVNAEALRALKEGRKPENAVLLRRELDDLERQIREFDEGSSVPGIPSMMHKRSIDIPHELVLDYIETDALAVMEAYQRKMAPNIEMARQFGDSRMVSALADLKREFDELIEAASPEDAKWLTEERDGQLQAVRDLRDSVMGLYKTIPDDQLSERKMRLSQFMKDFSMTTLMGRPLLAALADTGAIVFTQGFTPVMRGLVNLVGDFNVRASAFEQGWLEAKRAGLVDELNSGLRVQQLYDLSDYRIRTSGIEQFMHRNASRIMVVNGLSWWTDQMRGFASHIVIDKMLSLSERVATGKASSDEIALLRKAGIGDDLARQFHEQWLRGGGSKYDTLFVANTDAWTNPELVRQFRAVLNQEVMQAIIQPTAASKPLFMSDPIWSMLLQYKSFGIAATQQIGISGFQRVAGGNKLDAGVYSGVLSMIAMGYMIDSFKTPGWAEVDFEERVFRAVELSGVLGVFSDLNSMMEQATGGELGMRAMMGMDMIVREPTPADQIGALLGPAANQWGNLAWAMFSDEATGDQKARAIRYMVPYNNLVWWHGGVSQLQRSLGNTLEGY